MDKQLFCERHIDSLREAGNIGAGNAVTALSIMLHKTVNMSGAKVRIGQANELNVFGSEESYIVAMIIMIHGDIDAMLILGLEIRSAEELVDSILAGRSEVNAFTELELSALCETGNILSGSYLNALGTLTNLELIPSVPQMALDMAGAIWSFPATEFVTEDNNMMFIETYFTDQKRLLNGTYMLVLGEVAFEKIVDALDAML